MGLIKSIQKRIKKIKEKKANRKFKEKLESDIESLFNSSELGIITENVEREREINRFLNFISSEDSNFALHTLLFIDSRTQTR